MLDYGAKCDDPNHDSGPGFSAALVAAEANNFVLHGVNCTFYIKTPIAKLDPTHHHGGGTPYGLDGMGAALTCQYGSTQPVLDFSARAPWQVFNLSVRNLNFSDSCSAVSALRISTRDDAGTASDGVLYNVDVFNIRSTGFQDAFVFEGNLFESHFSHLYTRSASRDGLTFGNVSFTSGIASQMSLSDFESSFNGRYGLRTTFSYRDLDIRSGRLISNDNASFFFDQGITHMQDVTMENSCDTIPYSDTACADIMGRNTMYLENVAGAGIGATNGARFLIILDANPGGGVSTCNNCWKKMQAPGPETGLAHMQGVSTVPVLRVYNSVFGTHGIKVAQDWNGSTGARYTVRDSQSAWVSPFGSVPLFGELRNF